MKKMLTRLGAGIIALSLAFSQTAFALTSPEEEEPVTKDESVFVILNSDGSVNKQIVSNWLHSDDGVKNVEDKSVVQGIENIKSDTKPQIKDNKVKWNSDEKDIYYRGTTDQKLPVSASIRYLLDGKEITAKDLAGKSGQVEIRISLKNNYAEQRQIDGEVRTVAPLFACAVVVDLPADNFTNIKAEDGIVLSESVNQMVAFVGLPGLKESFKGMLDDEFSELKDKMKDEFVITAQAENFELPPIMVGAAKIDSDLLDSEDLDGDLDELKDGLHDLEDAAQEILDGTVKLADACVEFDDKMGEFQDKYVEFDDGINDALDGSQKLHDGAGKLKDGAKELYDGTSELSAKVAGLTGKITPEKIQAIGKLAQLLPSISISQEDLQTIQSLPTVISSIPGQMADGILETLKNYTASGEGEDGESNPQMLSPAQYALVEQVVSGAKQQTQASIESQLSTVMPKIENMLGAYQQFQGLLAQLGDPQELIALLENMPDALGQLQTGVAKLNDGAKQLKDGTQELYDGSSDLLAGMQKLDEASDEITDAISQFKDATTELKDKTQELSDGVKKFKEEGIDELYDKIMDLTDTIGKAMDISDQVADVTDSFGSYTGAPEGAKTDVKFLMRTPQIKADTKEDESQPQNTEVQKESFWDRIKNLFSFGK
ncbi:hypothetical protein [Zongyangia hominis]|uniref:X-X-X-Leu-X-X-Gly heptad repeat-containing protein n=1 Tax=Zongyangia hominis TaxID=2763677 RepID=A0A926I7J2_9FIRM|nr:hypothetical protein [Zongyangia hominis]MBC8571169.1 hypothetical protein [Zongyangia hominis]